MKFTIEGSDIEIPTGEELLSEVQSEMSKTGSIYYWTIMKIFIYLLMKDTGKDVY